MNIIYDFDKIHYHKHKLGFIGTFLLVMNNSGKDAKFKMKI